MAEPYMGMIQIFPYIFAPRGWAKCDGQLLPIAQFTGLHSLIGTIYGGDGTTTFALPNFQGSMALHQGQGPGLANYTIGQSGGDAEMYIDQSQMPSHTHIPQYASVATTNNPMLAVWAPASGATFPVYDSTGRLAAVMSPYTISTAGSGMPHNNMQPSLALLFCICMEGYFPPRG